MLFLFAVLLLVLPLRLVLIRLLVSCASPLFFFFFQLLELSVRDHFLCIHFAIHTNHAALFTLVCVLRSCLSCGRP